MTHAPTELLNPIHVEEHLAGPWPVEVQPAAQPAAQFAEQFVEPGPAPTEVPPMAAPARDAGPTEVLPLEVRPAQDESIPLVASRAERSAPARRARPRAENRRARAAAAPVADTPHRRALRRQSEVPTKGSLKDDLQGPLVILAVLCAIVAIGGGIKHNSFLGWGGGLLSGAAILAVIIIGLTSPKK